jgi:D-alanine-D-alanine ligase
VEEFVDGREFNITVLGTNEPKAMPVSEIVYSLPPETPRILSFSAKWDPQSIYFERTKAVCPAEIDLELREHIVQTALLTFRLLGSRGYARVDFRLDTEGHLKVIEINPNPDISPDAGAALQARAAGMTYNQFIEQIVHLAV